MFSVNEDGFVFSLPIQVPFFSCPIALVRTFSTILNRSCESRYHFIPEFGENTLSLSQLSMILYVGFL